MDRMAGFRRGGAAAALLVCALLLTACGGGSETSADRETGPGRFLKPPTNLCESVDPAPFVAEYGTPRPGEDHLEATVRDCSFEFEGRMGSAPYFLDLFADFRPSVEDARSSFARMRDKPSDDRFSALATVKKLGDAAFAFDEEPNDHEVRSILVVRQSNLVVTVWWDDTVYGSGPDRSEEHRNQIRSKLANYAASALTRLATTP
ncbi:hypothetical protein GCM10023235_03720 [Kitasatospora terrestris]|uniref:DUF3558 domain-containing protein n=2 Tax=Kitasatospora terrestris TaxID=258051 RepID=A0ABP9D6W1_9ACTN